MKKAEEEVMNKAEEEARCKAKFRKAMGRVIKNRKGAMEAKAYGRVNALNFKKGDRAQIYNLERGEFDECIITLTTPRNSCSDTKCCYMVKLSLYDKCVFVPNSRIYLLEGIDEETADLETYFNWLQDKKEAMMLVRPNWRLKTAA